MKTITPWHERHMATNDPLMAGIHMEAEISELRRYIAELEAKLGVSVNTGLTPEHEIVPLLKAISVK